MPTSTSVAGPAVPTWVSACRCRVSVSCIRRHYTAGHSVEWCCGCIPGRGRSAASGCVRTRAVMLSAQRPMAAYMRGQFSYLGIPAPRRSCIAARRRCHGLRKTEPARNNRNSAGAVGSTRTRVPVRGVRQPGRNFKALDVSFLPVVAPAHRDKSWWDTVDTLAANTVGGLVQRFPPLLGEMDSLGGRHESLGGANGDSAPVEVQGIRRIPNGYSATARCGRPETDFFIRKAIGWALRQYSKTDPEAVRSFVAKHEAELSGLSKREALLTLNGGRKGKRTAG